jgi:hypothetical protein
VRIARTNLVHAYDRVGPDCFNICMGVPYWELEPRGPDLRALFRVALRAQRLVAESKKTRP